MDLTFNLSVPALPDNDVWFANSAAWSSYWSGIQATVSFANATTTEEGIVKMADNSIFTDVPITNDSYYNFQLDLDGDGNLEDYPVPTRAQFDQLKAQVTTLVAAYKNLLLNMKNAGIINKSYTP